VAVSIIVGYFIIKSRRLPIKVYLPPLVFANTGNMGLPLLLFAFGNEGFKVGILYMVSMTVLHYSLGIMILSFDKSPFELFKLPLLYSAMVGILLSLSDWSLPAYLERALRLLGEASIPTMIFSLGYKLSEVNISQFKKSLAFGGMRIGMGFILGIGVVKLFNINGLSSNVVVLESSMPPAVFNFVLAEKYNQDPKTVASIILVGTIISVITTPLIIFYLLK
jgi:predicted permease